MQSKGTVGRIAQFIRANLTFPIEAVTKCNKWLQSEFCNLLEGDKCFIRGIELIKKETMNWTLTDYMQHYQNQSPKFAAVTVSESQYYYSIDESFDILMNLLQYQHQYDTESANENFEQIKYFLYELYTVYCT